MPSVCGLHCNINMEQNQKRAFSYYCFFAFFFCNPRSSFLSDAPFPLSPRSKSTPSLPSFFPFPPPPQTLLLLPLLPPSSTDRGQTEAGREGKRGVGEGGGKRKEGQDASGEGGGGREGGKEGGGGLGPRGKRQGCVRQKRRTGVAKEKSKKNNSTKRHVSDFVSCLYYNVNHTPKAFFSSPV